MNLALLALNQVLQLIASIKGQAGLTDEQIATQVQVVTKGNADAYTAMMQALGSLPKP
jgi:hypothetical protein